MSNQKDSSKQLPSESARSRRKFLENTVLAAAGTSAAALTVTRSAAAADKAPLQCPNIILPMKDVEGKVAFITGGDSGIGLGIARAFTQAGMKVVITYRTDSHLEEAMKVLADAKDRVHAIKLDVTDRPGMEKAADETIKVFNKVHVIVNNAGVGPLGGLSTATYDDFDWAISVNLTGVFNGVHTFLPRIKAQGEGGYVITTSSIAGLLGHGMMGVYTSSKFGAVGMMESLRSEMEGSNIGVSVFCPGIVNTNITNSERNRPANMSNSGFKVTPEMAARMQEQMKKGGGPPPIPGLDPFEAGRMVLEGMRNNDLYILTTPELAEEFKARGEAIYASVPDIQVPEGRTMLTRQLLGKSVYAVQRDRQLCRPRTKKA